MDVAGALLIEGPIALIDAEAVYVVKSDVPEPWCEEEAERVVPDRFRWIRKGRREGVNELRPLQFQRPRKICASRMAGQPWSGTSSSRTNRAYH